MTEMRRSTQRRSETPGSPVTFGASEQIAVQIHRHIHEQALAPGDFLGREGDLAAEFGVSRATLREALKLLASGNLIRASKGPGGGIFVAHTAEQGMSRSLSDSIAMMLETGSISLEELLDARELLEVPLAGVAAYRATEESIANLRAAVEAAAEPGRRDDGRAFGTVDAAVHSLVASMSGNAVIRALTGWVLDVVQPSLAGAIGQAVVHSAVVDQHRALVTAIEKGDSARAERAMRDHLHYLRDVLRIVRERERQ
jgi:GntR family transcriptional repressor for pyruvate dehydrogenase complex